MSQVSQFSVADGSGASVRSAINAVLEALASSNSGATAPANPVLGETWVNSSVTPRTFNVYDDVSASWITIAYLEANGVWALIEPQADLRYLKLAGGTLTGALTGTSASLTSLTVNGVSVNNAALLTAGNISVPVLGTPSGGPGFLYNPSGITAQWKTVGFSDLAGSISNGQVPLGPVQQWQSSLSIAFGQITGTVNANELEGYVVNTNPTPSTIALRDGGGYLWATYFNQSSQQNENPPIAQVAVNNGQDNFWRKAGLAYFANQLDLGSVISPNGYQKLPNGRILQWATVNLGDIPGGGTISGAAFFPLTFSNIAGWATDAQDLNGGLGSFVWNTTSVGVSSASFGAHEVVSGVVQNCQFRIFAVGFI